MDSVQFRPLADWWGFAGFQNLLYEPRPEIRPSGLAVPHALGAHLVAERVCLLKVVATIRGGAGECHIAAHAVGDDHVARQLDRFKRAVGIDEGLLQRRAAPYHPLSGGRRPCERHSFRTDALLGRLELLPDFRGGFRHSRVRDS